MKRKVFITVLLLSSIFVFSSIASAAWYVVTVDGAGIDAKTGATLVRLTYVSNISGSDQWAGPRWFIASGDNAKAILAVGLTCVSTGNQATAELLDVAEFQSIAGLYMNGQ
jgi:hypothetical protein